MYRLLIADDEALEREGLEWIVQNMLPGQFEVIHAENGRTSIERAEEHRPHIVLMDVNMPGIQGLDALREIKRLLPDMKMVLVTAYDYFSYAKEALTLGVKEYIVKPARREQVVQILQQLVDELEQERLKRAEDLQLRDRVSQLQPLVENELALMFMVDQVTGATAPLLSEWLGFPLDQGCSVVIAFSELVYSQDKKKIYDTVRSFAKSHFAGPSLISSFIDRHMAVFLSKTVAVQDPDWQSTLRQYGEKLCALTERQLSLTASIGIGSTHSNVEGLRKSYFEAVFASTYFEEGGKVCLFEDVTKLSGGSALNNPGEQRESAEHRSYVLSALQRIREEREEQTIHVLDKAKSYIESKFTEDISLEEVADVVHLNPHYFSKVFKQHIGETFIDFLTRLRIEKAKELMASNELSLKEVCFEVGYKDPNYFSRVFKRVTGMTPTEYRGQES